MFDGRLDPHFWMDVSLWRLNVPIIIKELSRMAPQHKSIFEENGRKLMEELLFEHEEIKKKMLEVKKRNKDQLNNPKEPKK